MEDRFKFRTYIPDLKFFKYWGWIEDNHYVGLCACGDYQMPELLEKYTNQCTGLKDKNGKLIYEGDIVNTYPSGFFDAYNDIFFIKNNLCGFYLATPYKKMSGDWESQDTIGCYDKEFYEVIGNIYENPELLEE